MDIKRTACCILGALLFAGTAQARHERDRRHELRDPGQHQGISADQAVERAESATGGRVLSVDPRGDGYRVKVLTPDGRVRTLHFR